MISSSLVGQESWRPCCILLPHVCPSAGCWCPGIWLHPIFQVRLPSSFRSPQSSLTIYGDAQQPAAAPRGRTFDTARVRSNEKCKKASSLFWKNVTVNYDFHSRGPWPCLSMTQPKRNLKITKILILRSRNDLFSTKWTQCQSSTTHPLNILFWLMKVWFAWRTESPTFNIYMPNKR